MKDHWEVGVVLALRDAQWLKANPGVSIPPLNISLDGNAESKMGDGLFEMDERFFLLEIKPDHSFCDSEWTDAKGPKRAYKKLMDLAAQDEAQLLEPTLRLRLSQSARGHFFAFWGESTPPNPDSSHFQRLFFQPYLLTALKALPAGAALRAPGACYSGRPSKSHATSLLLSLPIGLADANHLIPKWPLTMREMMSTGTWMACSCKKSPDASTVKASDLLPVGLDMEELQQYVDFLCKESTEDGCQQNQIEEDLKLVLMGTKGFIRHISGTSQLMMVIRAYKANQLKPTKGRAPPIEEQPKLKLDRRSPKYGPRA